MEPMRRQPAATTRLVHVKVSIDQLPAAQGRTGAGGRKAVGLQGRWGCKGAGGAMALDRRSCRFWRLVTSTRTAAKSTAQPRTSSKREQPARQISAVDLARAGCDHEAPGCLPDRPRTDRAGPSDAALAIACRRGRANLCYGGVTKAGQPRGPRTPQRAPWHQQWVSGAGA